MLRLSLLFIALLIAGCSTSSITVKNLDIPLYSIKKAIENSFPVGTASESRNGRVLRSDYYLKLGDGYVKAKKLNRRFYAIVKLLGDRRPYKIEVTVYKEKKVEKSGALMPEYAKIGEDKTQAKILSRNILRRLNKRLDGVNVIDEFKVF